MSRQPDKVNSGREAKKKKKKKRKKKRKEKKRKEKTEKERKKERHRKTVTGPIEAPHSHQSVRPEVVILQL